MGLGLAEAGARLGILLSGRFIGKTRMHWNLVTMYRALRRTRTGRQHLEGRQIRARTVTARPAQRRFRERGDSGKSCARSD